MRAKLRLYSGLAAAGLTAVLVGCSDAGVAPKSTAVQDEVGPSLSVADNGDNTVATFVYDPDAPQIFNLGRGHKIFFDANAVCDPQLSTYGPTEWDQPCTALSTPITITAVSYTDADGHARIDFSPALRFVPESYVVLYMKDPAGAQDTTSTITWCPDGGSCVDESVTRLALKTKRDASSGIVFRLIKHFSGYNVSAGRSAQPE